MTYEVERVDGERIMLLSASRESLRLVDSVVFDCDGVLIDVRRSYDATILRTAEAMVKGFSGARLPIAKIGGEIILEVRRTGGFNDDWATTYALTVFSVLALGDFGWERRLTTTSVKVALARVQRLVREFASRDRLEGRASVDQFLKSSDLGSDRIEKLRLFLDSPSGAVHNRMTRAFDETYYGGRLFQKIFGLKPIAKTDRGLIDKERVLITAEQLRRLTRTIGGKRIAMATGRPHVAVKYTLGDLLRYFDEGASVFIGDGDIKPELLEELRKYRKPSPTSIVRAYEKLTSGALLYIGDSAEDRLMVENAKNTSGRYFFGGITATSFSQKDQTRYFTQNGADIVMKNVGTTPGILQRVKE
jgi:HAD superfamily phosphatase